VTEMGEKFVVASGRQTYGADELAYQRMSSLET